MATPATEISAPIKTVELYNFVGKKKREKGTYLITVLGCCPTPVRGVLVGLISYRKCCASRYSPATPFPSGKERKTVSRTWPAPPAISGNPAAGAGHARVFCSINVLLTKRKKSQAKPRRIFEMVEFCPVDLIMLLPKQLGTAQKALAVSQRKYVKGAADIVELLNTQAALADTRQESIRCLAEWRSARLRLLASAGQIGRAAAVE